MKLSEIRRMKELAGITESKKWPDRYLTSNIHLSASTFEKIFGKNPEFYTDDNNIVWRGPKGINGDWPQNDFARYTPIADNLPGYGYKDSIIELVNPEYFMATASEMAPPQGYDKSFNVNALSQMHNKIRQLDMT